VNRINQTDNKINSTYIAVCCIAAFVTFFFHELAHWFAGGALGYKMALQLNQVYPLDPYRNFWHPMIVGASGPAFTILQAIVFYLLMRPGRNSYLYPFLFTPFYMRLLAGRMNLISLNDEGRISHDLGIGTYTISVLVSAFLFFLVYKTSKRIGYGLKFNLLTLLVVLLFSSLIILADQYMKLRVI
jgi:hypothetical protein